MLNVNINMFSNGNEDEIDLKVKTSHDVPDEALYQIFSGLAEKYKEWENEENEDGE